MPVVLVDRVCEILKAKGFVVTPLFNRQAFELIYYGVTLEIGMIDIYRCRNAEEVINLVRQRYRALGGSMKVQIVRVAVDSSKAEYNCIQVEAYPGDIRWQCGKCKTWGAWVRPELGAACQKRCTATVCYVERQNLFGQRLVDQYDKSGQARRYFVYMDDQGKVQIKPDSEDKPDPLDFKDIAQTMQEQIEKARAAEAAREATAWAVEKKLQAMDAVRIQREMEIAQAKKQYDDIRSNMLREYQVQATMMLGPFGNETIYPKKDKKPKKEKKPKPAKAPKPGVRRFREFPE